MAKSKQLVLGFRDYNHSGDIKKIYSTDGKNISNWLVKHIEDIDNADIVVSYITVESRKDGK